MRPHYRLRILQQWIGAHGTRHLTLKEAARIAGLEPHHFSATFHLRVGLRFVQWTREHRTAFAVRALESGRYSIEQVAEFAGYRDRRTLERAVKRATGKTPAEIQRRNGD
ncbi:MAG: helix-turn-helix transcriptional regulator [Proteobacteria bacterium]|nr:helix-turn-helix transcriptional regulator [Pseudomonadota bacterium]